MILRDFTPAKRREVVTLASAPILAELADDVGTVEIVDRIVRALHLDAKDRPLVASILTREIAPTSPHARKGEPFARFGQIMHRWTWGPAKNAARRRAEALAAEADGRAGLEDLL